MIDRSLASRAVRMQLTGPACLEAKPPPAAIARWPWFWARSMSLGSLVERRALLLIEESEEWLSSAARSPKASLRQVLSSDKTIAENVNTAPKEGVIELNAA